MKTLFRSFLTVGQQGHLQHERHANFLGTLVFVTLVAGVVVATFEHLQMVRSLASLS